MCFNSFWRFQTIFSFCVVGPYLSLVKKFIFRQKKRVLIFRPKNHFQTIFIFFAVFNVFDLFSAFVHFGRFGCFAASFE